MAHPTKQQWQAKSQRALGAKTFNNGFVQDFLRTTLDPDYEPDTWPDEVDSDTQSLKDMAFSILDDSDINEGNSDDSDSDADIICTGEKRKTGKEVNKAPDDEKTDDYIERYHEFIQKTLQKDDAKLPKWSMPSYTGTGCTTTYL
ncbi:hypothetical protein SCLCIDRAFT_7465 [Scleroderma citrinum Foug A]|uniref:Uncharacterized protein n=1 Tax=Scleroderma citrinum Foug A TaxID=1036808 RepID=A0A0C3A1B9_9AGAM|nr:hypothetical protein SCLCIDRAFT_7465 [Scleroderma citrinum Foug A]